MLLLVSLMLGTGLSIINIPSAVASTNKPLATHLSAGETHTVGLKKDGTVIATGRNSSSQLAIGNWTDITEVSAGGLHTVGLKTDGTVLSAGSNSDGQRNVDDWENIIQVAAGRAHTVGLKEDGTVVATGGNFYNQTNVADWEDIVYIAAGMHHTIGVKKDGTVIATGINNHGQANVDDWEDIIQVAANLYHTIGLKSDGSVVAVGSNSSGQINVEDWQDIAQITSGAVHTVGVKKDGTVVATGFNVFGQIEVGDWEDIVQVAAGEYYTVGLKSDGTVLATNYNEEGQTNVQDWKLKALTEKEPPFRLPNHLGSGALHIAGLNIDGSVMATGSDSEGRANVGDWEDIIELSGGDFHTVGLKADGSVVAVGRSSSILKIGDWEGIVQAVAGGYHTIGLKEDGTLIATGLNNYGQTNVGDWENIVQISAGAYSTFGLRSDRTVIAVGFNGSGQLNLGDWKDIVQIEGADYHTVGLKADGTVVAAGSNGYGQSNVGDWKNIKQVAAGTYHTVGLKNDGTVIAVGFNSRGQLEVEDWKDIIQIATGDNYTAGLKSDGSVLIAGSPSNVQLDVDNWKVKTFAPQPPQELSVVSTSGSETEVEVSWDPALDWGIGTGSSRKYELEQWNGESWDLIGTLSEDNTLWKGKLSEAIQTMLRIRAVTDFDSSPYIESNTFRVGRPAPPDITDLPPKITNQATINIAGIAEADSEVKVSYGEQEKKVQADERTGAFTIEEIVLTPNEMNELKVVAISHGLTSEPVNLSIQHDDRPPAAPTITVEPEGWTNAEEVFVTITNGADEGSGVARTEYRIGTEEIWVTYEGILTVTKEGETKIEARTIDQAGNISTVSDTTVQIDRIAPTAPQIEADTSAWTNADQVIARITIEEADANVEYQLNGVDGEWISYTEEIVVTEEGETMIYAQAVDRAGNISDVVESLVRIDRTAPELTLLGENPMYVLYGEPFEEPGYQVADNITDNLEVDVIGEVDTNEIGVYTITYSVQDEAGNETAQTRTVHVVDEVQPVIILKGDNPLILEVGTDYEEPGATAEDNVDGDISGHIQITGDVDTSKLGIYQVTYQVADSSENQTEVTRTVEVVDTTAPEITLEGSREVTIELGDIYEELGAVAKDNYGGDISDRIDIIGNVDTSRIGTYQITYTVADNSQNSTSKIRTVHVVDTTPPADVIFETTSVTIDHVTFTFSAKDLGGIKEYILSRNGEEIARLDGSETTYTDEEMQAGTTYLYELTAVDFSKNASTVKMEVTTKEKPILGAPVTVKHMDEAGNEIAEIEELTGNIGEPYETEPKAIKGYTLIQEPENATGTFIEEAQTVTYVYALEKEEPKPGESVTVKHVNEEGTELLPVEELNGNIGDSYQTYPAIIEGYEIVQIPSNATGEFTNEVQTVIYVYAPVQVEIEGRIIIEYVDEIGNPVSGKEIRTGLVGETYETEPKNIEGYELIQTPDNATGTFTEEAQIITYVYSPLKEEPIAGAPVTVNYVDEEGNNLVTPETLLGNIGESYETEAIQIDGYEVLQAPDNAIGTFTNEAQMVIYIYTPVEGSLEGTVIIEYIDEAGISIKHRETKIGLIGEPYETNPKEIKDYRLIQTPDNASGIFTEEIQLVTYLYTLNKEEPIPGAPVMVKHVDEEGNELFPAEELIGNIGESYHTYPAIIKGYEVIQTPDNATGSFTNETQFVTYVYTSIEEKLEGTIIIEYVDEAGHSIAGKEIRTGLLGEIYEIVPKVIKGYQLVETPENAVGVFKEETQTITYVYAPIKKEPTVGGPVTIIYVDEDGKELLPSKELTGNIGDAYQTKAKVIEGFALTQTPENASGIFTEVVQIVEYVYTLEKATEPIESGTIEIVLNRPPVEVFPGTMVSVKGTQTTIQLPTDLPEDTQLQVLTTPLKEQNGLKQAGEVYDFTFIYPKGHEDYQGEFILTMGVDNDGEQVAIYYYQEELGEWQLTGGTRKRQKITAIVSHFSMYGVFVKEDAEEESSSNKENQEITKPSMKEKNKKEEVSFADNKEEQLSGEEATESKKEAEEASLPNTATNQYNWLIVGILLIILGSSRWVIRRNTTHKEG